MDMFTGASATALEASTLLFLSGFLLLSSWALINEKEFRYTHYILIAGTSSIFTGMATIVLSMTWSS